MTKGVDESWLGSFTVGVQMRQASASQVHSTCQLTIPLSEERSSKMNKSIIVCAIVVCLFGAANMVWADWQRTPASDVDKEFISGNPGLQPGVPSPDNSCWMAAATSAKSA